MSEELGKTFIAAQIAQGQVDKRAFEKMKQELKDDTEWPHECCSPRPCVYRERVEMMHCHATHECEYFIGEPG